MSRTTRRPARLCGVGLALATASALGVTAPASGAADETADDAAAAAVERPALYAVGDRPGVTYLPADGGALRTVARIDGRAYDVAAVPRTGDLYVGTDFSLLKVSQDGDVEVLHESEQAVQGVAATPDGGAVAVEGQTLVRVARDGEVTTSDLDFESAGVDVADDGTLYLGDFLGQTVQVLAPDGGRSTLGTDLANVVGVALADDGDVVVAAQNGPGDRVLRVSADGTGQEVVGRVPDGVFGVEVDADDNVYVTSPDPGVLTLFPADSSGPVVLGRGERYGYGVTVAELFVSADLSSARPVNAAGWFRTPVTVSWTCGGGTAPLTCPEPSTVDASARGSRIVGTVTDAAGDTATDRALVQVDTVAPTLTTRLTGSAPYSRDARPVRCAGQDAGSGIARACRVAYSRVVAGPQGGAVRRWTATVKDVAGSTATRSGTFRVRR